MMKFCVLFLMLFATFQIYIGINGCVKEAKANTVAEQEYPAKVIYSAGSTNITRIVDEEMKTVCYIVYRSSVGTSISCVGPR
jgi:hypothetical protein